MGGPQGAVVGVEETRKEEGSGAELESNPIDLNDFKIIKEGEAEILMHSGNEVFFNKTQVINEVQLQFSSGIQTVAIIPATPHGVIQLGSSLAYRMEDLNTCLAMQMMQKSDITQAERNQMENINSRRKGSKELESEMLTSNVRLALQV